jgi:hypothetical protein
MEVVVGKPPLDRTALADVLTSTSITTRQCKRAGFRVHLDQDVRTWWLVARIARANDLGAHLSLEAAAKLLAAMARTKHPLFDRAAVRWISRYVGEAARLQLAELVDVVDAIAELREDPSAAETLFTVTKYQRHRREFKNEASDD